MFYYSDGEDSYGDEDSYYGGGGCSCGMCGPNPFAMLFMSSLMGGFGGPRDPWRNRREKSDAASAREAVVKRRFNVIKDKVDATLQEKTKVRDA